MDFVNRFQEALMKEPYSDAVWKQLTGKTLPELWREYQANPSLQKQGIGF